MSTTPLTPQQLEQISEAIQQAMTQLKFIETGTDIKPMRYNARLCWEQLYETRELLRTKLSTE